MTKIYHTRESILDRLSKGPAQFSEWAWSKNHKHQSRIQARNVVKSLMDDGLILYVHIGRYPYYILNTEQAKNAAIKMQIEENAKASPCGCIHWTGYSDPIRGPVARVLGSNMPKSVRRILWEIERTNLGTNSIIKMTCDDEWCINVLHMKKVVRNSHQRGKVKPLAVKKRMAEAMRKIRKVGEENAEQIRMSEEPNKVLAERYGCTPSNISSIKRGVTYKKYGANPFTGL